MAVAMQRLLTTRVCILTGAYLCVLGTVNSKKRTRLVKVKMNELRPTLTSRVIFASRQTRGQRPKSGIALRNMIGYGMILPIQRSLLIQEKSCDFRPLLKLF